MDSSNHADEETENKEGVEREDSVEENEPKLKYMRITNDLKKILSKVSANCIAIHPKFVCVGTDWGIIHILDHNGNSVVSKDLRAHSVAVNQISIDANGDHIASCSDDGKVFVTGLYNSDNNQEVMIGRLVKSVAIDPNYYKSGSGRRFISGDERLVLHEKTFLSRVRSTVLNDATFEGGVKNMRWSPGGDFLAWSTHLGFRVYDIATRESLGFVKWLSRPSDDNVKCHLCWKDNSMLIVGWAEMVRVCTVTLKTHQITTLPEVSPYEVRLIYTFQTDFTVCGVGPLDCWLVVLGSVKDGERPQLHIIDPTTLDFTNISTDNLSLRGYTQYTPSDYSLECLIEESRYVIVSPKDIVVACPYDINDRIEWLLNHGKFETALKIVSDDEGDKTKLPLKHSKLTVGLVYLDYLFSVENYQRAASLCFNILGKNKRLWEKEVYRFAKVHQLRAISSYLPTGDDRLLPHIYEMVLYEYLKMDPEGFLVVAKEWPAHYYNVPAVINAVIEHLLTTDPTSKPVILEALAVLYSLDGKHEKALAMSIKLRNKGVFELIKKHKLNVAIHDMVVGLMELDSKQAIATLLENKEIKPDVIVEKLKANRQYLYMYLDALDKKDTKLAQKYHGELVQLYADFDREKLLPLLKKSDRYPIEATLDICKNRKFTKEMVHLLGLIGSTKEALSLITKELGNIEEAVDFCIARDDLELWEDLISYSLNTQSFIIYLLKRIGTYIDPRILVQRIDNHMQIPGLKDALVKMLQDYNLQISVQEGFKKILVSDYFDLHQRFVSMQQRGISVGVFDAYEKARLTFVQAVSELSAKTVYIECLMKLGVLDLLVPLLSDSLVKVQQGTALALGRLVNNSFVAAQEVINLDLLPLLLKSMDKRSKYYKKSAMYVVRGLAKYNAEMANRVVQVGGMTPIMLCLEDFDPEVKEAAAWAVGYIAKHNHILAQTCVSHGAVQLLKLCLQEPELCLKQISLSALSDIAKHTPDLAQILVDSGCIPYIVKCFMAPDPRLKRLALCCLSNVAKHSIDLAEIVVEAEVFPSALINMGHPDPSIRKNAAILTKEVVKHHLQLAQLVVNSGGLSALIHFIASTESSIRLPGVMALGYIASQSEQLSFAIISLKGVDELSEALNREPSDHVQSALVWTLGQIGKHSTEHAKELALANVFPKFIELYLNSLSSEDLKQKCKGACKLSLTKCMLFEALEPLLTMSPPEILKYVLAQYSKILPNDAAARRTFVLSGGLKKVQEIEAEPGSTLAEYITIINYCFPEEIVRYYSPNYPEGLLQKVEEYVPQIPPLFSKDNVTEDPEDVDVLLKLEEPPSDWDECECYNKINI